MKRLISIDYLRGIAILGVVFYHATIFNSPPPGEGPTFPDILWVNVILLIITYFSAWAGMFGIISGTSNTISLYGGFRSGKIRNPKQILYYALFQGSMILLINYVYLFVFCPGWVVDNRMVGGFLPILIRTGQIFPSNQNYLFATALMMIGWSILLSGVLLYFLLRNNGYLKRKRNYSVLIALATFCVFIYPLIQQPALAFMSEALTITNFFPRLFLSWLVGQMDPILPYFGFALYGVISGLMLVDEEPKQKILKYGYGIGIIYTVIGLISTMIFGIEFPDFAVPPLPTILMLLGPMFLLYTWMLHNMDFKGEKQKIKWVNRSKTIRRVAIVSLTVFLLEGSMAQLLRHVMLLVYPGFDVDYLFMFFIFGTINLIVWSLILIVWEKIDFKYSFEWILIKLARKITHKESGRLRASKRLDSYVDIEKSSE